jgi:hypothetical protein
MPRESAAQATADLPVYGGLSASQYAEVLAHIRHFTQEDTPLLLERLGVTPEAWKDAERAWSRALLEEAQEEDSELLVVQAFGVAFTAARARLKADRPALSAILRVIQAQEREGASEEGQEVKQDSAALPPEVATASTAPPISAITPPPSPVVPRAMEHEAISPWIKTARSVPAPPPPPPPPPAPLAAATPGAPARPPEALGGTSLSLDIPRGPALPFAKSNKMAPPPPAITSPSPVRAPPAAPPRPERPPAQLGGTSLSLDVPRGAALPFKKTGAVSAPTPAPASEPHEDRAALSERGAEEAPAGPRSGSHSIDAPSSGPASAAPTSHAPRSQPAAPSEGGQGDNRLLGLEPYASLCVELSLAPDRIATTLARYRLTHESKEINDRYWSDKFAREPALRAAWDKAYMTYRDWLISSGWRPAP